MTPGRIQALFAANLITASEAADLTEQARAAGTSRLAMLAWGFAVACLFGAGLGLSMSPRAREGLREVICGTPSR